MTQQEARQLIDKYLQGNATPDERRLIESWYNQLSAQKPLSDNDDFEHLSEELWQNTLRTANLDTAKKKIFRFWPTIAVAASVSIFLLAGIHFFTGRKQSPTAGISRYAVRSHEILPGGNKAILILSNGKQVSLIGEKTGQIAKEHNATINKTAAGQIKYAASGSSIQPLFNTLVTPRGGQYTVVLEDGTKVTLNAASSIIFPTKFDGTYREVELKGEGYFEVAHDPLKPFRVKCNGQTIEVLGTHFNVNCYNNEPYVKTTLLQGSVKITSKNGNITLKPGQQSRLDLNGTNPILVTDVNTNESVAWKNGLFEFNASSIEEVMRAAERWYNVDVTYAGKGPDIRISGSMSRNVNFSGFVKLLEFEGVRFSIKEHNVTINN
jgi:transmembrane sensor